MTEKTHTTPDVLSGFDDSIAAALAADKSPGCSIVLLHGDRTLLSRGFGLRDVERSLPADERSLYGIASTSKAFTATALAMLADRGLLNWDDPVRRYLPDFRLSDEGIASRITPRDLVSHRTGLPRHDFLWYRSAESRQDLFSRLAHLPLSRDLRAEYQYNNLMFMVAGILLERITGETWEAFVRREIFEPLGMKRSNFSVRDLDGDENVALPYNKTGEALRRVPFCNLDAAGPCGSINSCVADLAHWLRFHLGQGETYSRRLLSAASLAETYRPQTIIPAGANQYSEFAEFGPAGYALGWAIRTYRGRDFWMHTGGIDGYSSLVAILPGEKIASAVLANRENTDLPLFATLELFDRILGLDVIPWRAVLAARQKTLAAASDRGTERLARRRKADAPSRLLEDYTGLYEHPGYGQVRIVATDGGLRLRYNMLDLQLTHYHQDIFHATGENLDLKMPVQFLSDEWGEINALTARWEPAVEPLRFCRRPDGIGMERFSRLAGRYHRPPAEKDIRVTTNGTVWVFPNRLACYEIVANGQGGIFLLVNGEPPRELLPERGLEFRVKGKPAERVEFHEENGEVITLDFVQEYSEIRAEKSLSPLMGNT